MNSYVYKDKFGNIRTFYVGYHLLRVEETCTRSGIRRFTIETAIPYEDIISVTSNLVDGAVCIRYLTDYGVNAYSFSFEPHKHRDLVERLVNDILTIADLELNF